MKNQFYPKYQQKNFPDLSPRGQIKKIKALYYTN